MSKKKPIENKSKKTVMIYIEKWQGLEECIIKPKKEVLKMNVRYIGTADGDDVISSDEIKYDIYANNLCDETYACKCN